ncbi:hypothetical protein [Streptomyces sp. CC53]|uniref:hypothetical protein n=1 Tax=Streptomyces sp. CC53 TaxID=1906740 RepID=UPI00210952F1|nr:hypothetical protein [Streptomyces sp. CC53]
MRARASERFLGQVLGVPHAAGQTTAVPEQLTPQRFQSDQELTARGLGRRKQRLRQYVERGRQIGLRRHFTAPWTVNGWTHQYDGAALQSDT